MSGYSAQQEAKLQRFLEWLDANRVELRGCSIRYSDQTKGFGLFSDNHPSDGVLLVVPLDLIITPMRVLQDPLLGPVCRAMFEEGEVDDRFLMNLFLIVERLRRNSSWKPYLDMLPTSFGNPLWFTDDELLELKGTTLYRATELQKRTLQSLYNDKVAKLVTEILNHDGSQEREASFEDFLWANSIFWTRAMNIPLPYSYVFPHSGSANCNTREGINGNDEKSEVCVTPGCEVKEVDNQLVSDVSVTKQTETVWVEGLVPGIDFCNHAKYVVNELVDLHDPKSEFVRGIIVLDFLGCNFHKYLKAAATWEVDGTGNTTGVPFSMYLLSAEQIPYEMEKEISISYGNKGNEELLYLYGFVIDNNPDDYLMVHYPVEAIQSIPFSDCKLQLLEAQKAELRCLLPRNLLEHGFFPQDRSNSRSEERTKTDQVCNYSWSGQRPKPAYFKNLVFPDNFLTALRTIAMQEDELFKVTSLLEELAGSKGQRQPSDFEVRAAVWEVSGDSGALQLLVDLLQTKMMDLEENSGTEDCDTELLRQACVIERPEKEIITDEISSKEDGSAQQKLMSRNMWSATVYRRGQKQLTRLFLREAEHALQLSLGEEN